MLRSMPMAETRSTQVPEVGHLLGAGVSSLPVSEKNNSLLFCVSLGHATQQQKLQSCPRFGAFKAHFLTSLLVRRGVFVQTPAVCPPRPESLPPPPPDRSVKGFILNPKSFRSGRHWVVGSSRMFSTSQAPGLHTSSVRVLDARRAWQ